MNYQKIKQYLNHQLTQEEKYAFELEMENNPFLKEAVEGFELNALQEVDFDQKEKELFDSVNMQLKKRQAEEAVRKEPVKRFFSIRYLSIAASFFCVVMLSWFLLNRNKSGSVDSDKLFATYYKPLTNPDALVRGDYTNTSTAVQAYEKEDYFAAVNEYKKLLEDDPRNVKNALFLGISYLSTNQPQKAVESLRSILDSQEYSYDIRWYLALAYLKTKETNKAIPLFEELANTDNFYQENAKVIVEKLGNTLAEKS